MVNGEVAPQVDEMLSFEPRVGKMKTGLTTSRFTVIIPKKY